MEPILKKSKCDLKKPQSDVEDESFSEEESDNSQSEEDRWWQACDTIPPYQDETGEYWTPLFKSNVGIVETRCVILSQNCEKKWIWEDDFCAWDDDFKPSAQMSYAVYDESAFLCADIMNKAMYFILKKANGDFDWKMFWKNYLVYYQVWFSGPASLPKKWEWVISDANLIQFTDKDQQNNNKFAVSFNNGRIACMRKILDHLNANVFLNHLDDVFFLQGSVCSDNLVRDGELKWCQVLPSGFDASCQHKHILAIALVTLCKDEDQKLKWVEIELIDSFVPHFGVAQRLMFKLREHFKVPLFPNDIRTNTSYWKKNFHLMLDPCIELAESDFFNFGDKHIKGFKTLFDDIYLHELDGKFIS